MSKQYYRDQIAYKKQHMNYVKEAIAQLRVSKRRTSQHFADSIRSTKNRSSKLSYRNQRISSNQSYDRQINSKQQELARMRKDIAYMRICMRREKS